MLTVVVALGLSSGAFGARVTSPSREAKLHLAAHVSVVGADTLLEASADEAWGSASRLAVSAVSAAAGHNGRPSASAAGAGGQLNVLPFGLPPMQNLSPPMLFGTREKASATRPSALLEASSDAAWGGASKFLLSGLSAGAGSRDAPAKPAGALRMFPVDASPMVIERVEPARNHQILLASHERGNAFADMGAELVKPEAAGENDEVVVLKRRPYEMRDIAMMNLLRGNPGIDSYIAAEETGIEVGLLRANELGSLSLGDRFKQLEGFEEGGRLPRMPFGESLPYLAEILRGVESLNEQRVVHLDLTGDDAIALVPDGSGRCHAVIRELGDAACVLGGRDEALMCKFFDTERAGSASRRAPEKLGTSNNVWQAGLLFAKMTLGVFPTDSVSSAYNQNVNKANEDNAGDHWRPQDKFSVAEHSPGFAEEYPGATALIEGMLEPNPANRWSPALALSVTEEMMAQLRLSGK